MAQLQQTLINGNRYSFTNVFVTIGGVQIGQGAFKSINYDAQQDPGLVQGNQVAPVGRTQGYGSGTGSFEMLLSECNELFSILTDDGAFPIMSPIEDFVITVSYSVNGVDVITDELLGCRITKIGSSNQQGSDATTKQCDMSIMQINLDGIPAYADTAI